jgi:hypothetical protein
MARKRRRHSKAGIVLPAGKRLPHGYELVVRKKRHHKRRKR